MGIHGQERNSGPMCCRWHLLKLPGFLPGWIATESLVDQEWCESLCCFSLDRVEDNGSSGPAPVEAKARPKEATSPANSISPSGDAPARERMDENRNHGLRRLYLAKVSYLTERYEMQSVLPSWAEAEAGDDEDDALETAATQPATS